MKSLIARFSATALAVALTTHPCWAGRPLGTDDADTAAKGTCQIEVWRERAPDHRSTVFAPACSVAEGFELGMDFTRLTPNENTNPAMGMAVKWVPRAWQSSNGLGEWQGGLKLAGGYEQPQGDARHVANTSLLGLVTLTVSPALTLHANVGHLRDRDRRQNATLFNVALTLAPTDVLLLFAETQTNDRRALFGATVNAIGGRWWLIKGRLGFDITASRRVGSTEGTTWTAGLGWYGIAF